MVPQVLNDFELATSLLLIIYGIAIVGLVVVVVQLTRNKS
jgi:hypothetical protein